MSMNPKGLVDLLSTLKRELATQEAATRSLITDSSQVRQHIHAARGGNIPGVSGSETAHGAAVDQSPVSEARKGRLRRPHSGRPSVPEASASFSLKPPTSPKQQIENHQQQNEAEAAAAIIAESWAHIVAAAAE